MECPKCKDEMVKANVNSIINIYGDTIKEPGRADYQKSYMPVHAYVCEGCGYIEFYSEPKK